MTDKQIRDRIVGMLSVSMMPMEVEAECVRFLDRCVGNSKPATASRADRIRSMADENLAAALLKISDGGYIYCKHLEECLMAVDQDKQIPESRCIACILTWLKEAADV